MTETRVLTRSVVEEFKNAKHHLTTEMYEVYKCPLSVRNAIITLCHVVNIDEVNDGSASIVWSDFSDEDDQTYLLPNANIAARAGLNVLHGKLILEPGDGIHAKADALNKIDLTLSIMEIS